MAEEIFEKDRLNKLAKAMQAGKTRAAETIYEKLLGKVYGFCLSRVRNQTIAEDLTQEIFLKLVDKITAYDPKKGDFVVWFWRLARNTLIDHYRRQKEMTFSDLETPEQIEKVASDNPQTNLEEKLKREKISAALELLNEEEQEIFRLRFLSELSYKEIAEILEKSEGALRVAVNRLKIKMQNKLKEI